MHTYRSSGACPHASTRDSAYEGAARVACSFMRMIANVRVLAGVCEFACVSGLGCVLQSRRVRMLGTQREDRYPSTRLHANELPYNHTTFLRNYHTTMLPYYHTTILPYYHTTIQYSHIRIFVFLHLRTFTYAPRSIQASEHVPCDGMHASAHAYTPACVQSCMFRFIARVWYALDVVARHPFGAHVRAHVCMCRLRRTPLHYTHPCLTWLVAHASMR